MMSAADLLKGLNPRHRLFAQAYCTNGHNATAAARAAGYSERSAAQRGYELVRNREIREAIDALLAESLMSPEELKARIADDALATLEPFLEGTLDGGLQFNFTTDKAKAARRWLKKVSITPTEHGPKIAIEVVDSQKAKDQLIRVMGLGSEKIQIESESMATRDRPDLSGVSEGALRELVEALKKK